MVEERNVFLEILMNNIDVTLNIFFDKTDKS